MLTRTAFTLMALALLSPPAAAADKKPAPLRDFPFWTAPKQPHAKAFVPGLQAALQLTPEQAEKIEAACRDTIDSPEVRAGKRKGDPTATAEELAAAAAKREAATEKLHNLVADILTAEQKRLIEKINDAYAKTISEVAGEFEARFVAAKGNPEEMAKARQEYQEAIAEAFGKKLDGLLTAEQKKAVEAAAAEEKKRQAENRDKPKKKPGD